MLGDAVHPFKNAKKCIKKRNITKILPKTIDRARGLVLYCYGMKNRQPYAVKR